MGERDPRDPLDEDAAWAEIVASYGEEPAFPAPEDRPSAPVSVRPEAGEPERPVTDLDLEKGFNLEPEPQPGAGEATGDAPPAERPESGPAERPGDASGDRPGSFIVYAPGVGPRDWSADESTDDADKDHDDEDDEGHFTPPEPPPLPQADVTTKFAWIAVLGGPLLLIVMMLLQQPVTWWITTLGIGGFLGGFATLVARMKTDDDDDEGRRPGGGAVV